MKKFAKMMGAVSWPGLVLLAATGLLTPLAFLPGLTPTDSTAVGAPGLIASWPLNDGTGTVAKATAASQPDLAFTTNEPPRWVQPSDVAQPVLEFAGGSGQLVSKENIAVDLATGMGFSLWVRPAAPGQGTLVSVLDSGEAARGYRLSLDQGYLFFEVIHERGSTVAMSKNQLALDRWQHVAVSCNAAGPRVYVDGQLVGDAAIPVLRNPVEAPVALGGGTEAGKLAAQLSSCRVHGTSLDQAMVLGDLEQGRRELGLLQASLASPRGPENSPAVATSTLMTGSLSSNTRTVSGRVVAVSSPTALAAGVGGCEVTVPCTPDGVVWGTVVAGQRYQCSASGLITINSGGTTRGPDGTGTPAGTDCGAGNPFKAPGLIEHSLIGLVGNQWVQLGSSLSFIAPVSGTLTLYLNDCFWDDNSGSWQACITVITVFCNEPARCGHGASKPAPCPTTREDQPNITVRNDPVNFGTSGTFFEEPDLQPIPLPGGVRAAALAFGRSQNSTVPSFAPFRGGWTHNYNVQLFENSNAVSVVDWRGSNRSYIYTNGAYAGDGTATLAKPDGTNFVWQLAHGTRFWFDAAQNHRLGTITDRIGNTVTLSYGAVNTLTGVVDNTGRKLSLGYEVTGLLQDLTDPLGRQVVFSYDGARRLNEVGDGLGTRAQYEYGDATWSNAITRLVNARGYANRFTYNSLGQCVAETNALGKVQTYTWLGANQAVTVTESHGATYTVYNNSSGAVTARVDAAGTTRYTRDDKQRPTSFTDRLGYTTQYVFDTNGCGCAISGNLLRMIDPLNRTNSWTYESSFNFPLTHTNAAGGVTLWTYDAKGNTTAETDPAGRITRCVYDGAGNRTSLTNANNHATLFAYDQYGNMTNTTDALGNCTGYGYDLAGRLTSRSDALGRNESYLWDIRDRLTRHINAGSETNRWGFDGNGNCTVWTNALGYATQYAYDELDRLTSITLPGSGSPFLRFSYDDANNRTNVTDGLSNTTRFGYDALGRLTAVTNALGKAWSFQVDAEGRRTRATNPNSHTNHFAYDAAGQLTSWTNALTGVTGFGYDKLGNLGTVTDPRGNAMTFGYDAISRLTNITHAGSSSERFAYDAVGNLTGVVNRAGQSIAFIYDAANRLTQKSYTGTNDVFSFGYDAANQLTGVTWRAGTTTNSVLKFTYDAAGRLTNEIQQVTRATTLSVGYEYYADGRRKKLTYPDGSWLSYEYNTNGWLTAIKDGGTNTVVSYSYDAAGRRTGRTLQNSSYTLYEYDAANQLTNVWHRQGGGATIGQYQYGYDDAGNRTWVKRSHQSNKGDVYSYDAADQLTGVKYNATNPDSAPSGWDREVLYYFDAAGNRTSLVERAGVTNTVTYSVNSLNQYTNVTVGAGAAHAWWKLDEGTGNSLADSSGNGYNGTRELGLWTNGVSGKCIVRDASSNYRLNFGSPVGNYLTNCTFSAWVRFDSTSTYHYMFCKRMVHRLEISNTDTRPYFAYGNGTTWQEGSRSSTKLYQGIWTHLTVTWSNRFLNWYHDGEFVGTSSFNQNVRANNVNPEYVGADYTQYMWRGAIDEPRIYKRLLSADEVRTLAQARSYGHDANGNLTNDNVWTYHYDPENRLREARSRWQIYYTYDALGRLIERRTAGNLVSTNRMYYAGWQMIAEYNGAGALQRKYVYGPGIDEPVRLTTTGGAGTNYYFHADGLGSVTEITGATGQLVERYRYDVYGTPTFLNATGTPIPASTIGNRLLFTARDRDPDTTWYNYRHRYYNPTLGRFVQPDPIGLAGGDVNLYRYCLNNPILGKDEFGRSFWGRVGNVVAGAVGGALGGLATGSLVGAVGGPAAAGTGALGAIAGAFSGAVSGFVSGGDSFSPGKAFGSGLKSGAITGLTGGIGTAFGATAGIATGAGLGALDAGISSNWDPGAMAINGLANGLFGWATGGTWANGWDDLFALGLIKFDTELWGAILGELLSTDRCPRKK